METKDFIISGLEQLTETVSRTLDGLTVDEIIWQPRPDANSIGIIFFHMARTEDMFIQSFIKDEKQIWETGLWYQKFQRAITDTGNFLTGDQVANFIVPEFDKLRSYSKRVRKETLEYLKGLSSDKYHQMAKLPAPPKNRPVVTNFQSNTSPFGDGTIGFILAKNLVHLSRHAGELSYLRGLKRGIDK